MADSEKKRVLLVDPDHKTIARVSARLWDESFVVDSVSTERGALLRLREFAPQVLVTSVGAVDGEQICRQAAKPGGPVSLLVFPEGTADAARRAEQCGADGFLVGAPEPFSIANCVRWAVRLREAERRVAELQRTSDERALEPARGSTETARLTFDLYKRLLLMELRRSRRYGHPLAFLVVGIDRYASTVGRLQIHQRTQLASQVMAKINDTIREIDLAVAESQERFHVCLPHTDAEGARLVAERLRERLPTVNPAIGFSVSVGLVAGSDSEPSFRELLDGAYARLERARSLGGNRVETMSDPLAPRAR